MPLPITDAPPKEHSPKRAGVARGSKHEIKEFLVSYNKLRNRKFRATHDASPDKARKLIEEGMNTFKKKRRKAA
jgi:hypothetical protein